MADDMPQGKSADQAATKFNEDDLLDLWKYFQDRADTLKDKQWTMGTWIVTLLSGVAAFSLSQKTLSITPWGLP